MRQDAVHGAEELRLLRKELVTSLHIPEEIVVVRVQSVVADDICTTQCTIEHSEISDLVVLLALHDPLTHLFNIPMDFLLELLHCRTCEQAIDRSASLFVFRRVGGKLEAVDMVRRFVKLRLEVEKLVVKL
jgi:hypothetical protein